MSLCAIKQAESLRESSEKEAAQVTRTVNRAHRPGTLSTMSKTDLLHLAQEQDGYLSDAGLAEVAELTGTTPADVRGTASFRSKYIPAGGVNPGNLNDLIINSATLNIDASASYKINDNFSLTFDGINLTNQQTFQYADSVGQRLYYNHYTGRNFFLGVRYSY